MSMLSELQAKITGLLSSETLHADEITALAGADVSEVLTELTELELLGIIKAYPGNRYSLNI
jgi:DNA processing protein